jgi:hypothetical protein
MVHIPENSQNTLVPYSAYNSPVHIKSDDSFVTILTNSELHCATPRDENEREWAGNYLSRFRYHIFLPKTGAGAGKAVAKTVAEYMGIRKRTHTNEYSTKTNGSRTAAGCTQHTGALQLSAIFFSDMSHAMTIIMTQAHCSCTHI